MVLNYTQLNLINWPIFALRSDDIEVEDGILRCENYILDDRNQIGKTLGARRLQTPHEPLYKLRKMYEDCLGLLTSKNQKFFIDSKGYFFIYERTKFATIKYHKILETIKKDIATVLKVSGVNHPIIVKRPPPLGMAWVGIVYINKKPWLPYDYSEYYCNDIRRKI